MSILVSLHHVTRYQYDRPVGLGPQVIRLRPAPHCRTRVPSYSLKVTPAQHFVNWQQDPSGNWLARFVFPEKTREFTITVDLVADMAVVNPFDFFVEPFAETFPFAYPTEFAEELAPYLDAQPAGPRLAAFLASVPRDRKNTVDFLVELNQRLQRDISYLIRMEAGVQTPEQTLAARFGLVSRQCVAAGAGPAASRSRGAFRIGLPHPVAAGRAGSRRAGGGDARLHRPARLGRGLYPGCRLDRPRCHLRSAVRGRPYPARRHAAFPRRGADQRRASNRQTSASPSTWASRASRNSRA